PADRPLPAGLLQRADSGFELTLLLVSVERHGIDPAPAVTRRLVAGLVNPFAYFGVALHRNRSRVEGHAQAVFVEEAQQAHDPRASAELVDRLGVQVSMIARHDIGDLRQALVSLVASRDRILGALLVIDDEVDGHAGALRPDDLRETATVAHEVPARARDVKIDQLHLTLLLSRFSALRFPQRRLERKGAG